jgi:hypothetical protein
MKRFILYSSAISFLQGRQKLARYGPKEFTTFVYDILNEVRRRYHGIIQQSPVSPVSSSKCKYFFLFIQLI